MDQGGSGVIRVQQHRKWVLRPSSTCGEKPSKASRPWPTAQSVRRGKLSLVKLKGENGGLQLAKPFLEFYARHGPPLPRAPLRSAPLRSASLRAALLRSAPLRSAPRPLRSAPPRAAPRRAAPLGSAPRRSAPPPRRSAPLRSAAGQFVPNFFSFPEAARPRKTVGTFLPVSLATVHDARRRAFLYAAVLPSVVACLRESVLRLSCGGWRARMCSAGV